MATANALEVDDTPTSTFEELLQLKTNLQAVRRKLLSVNPDQLDDAAHERWVDQVFELGKAINALRNAALETLSQEFKRELPRLEAGTAQLAKDLRALRKAVDIVNVVSGALGVVTSIVGLLG